MRSWTWMMVVAVVGLSGCLDYARIIFRFDLKAGVGTMIVEDIGSSSPEEAASDFAGLVNDDVLGDSLQEGNPEWRVGKRELYAHDGHLDARVTFEFDDPADVGLYKHDKKSPYLWCVEGGDHIVSTSGTLIEMYDDCVMFDRKAKVVEVTVATGHEGAVSLLSQFEAWDGKRLPEDP